MIEVFRIDGEIEINLLGERLEGTAAPRSSVRVRTMHEHSLRACLLCLPCVLLASGCYVSNPLEEPESGTRLRAIVYQPESGEPIFGGWYDTELEEECSFRPTPDGTQRCQPLAALTIGVSYRDEGCTEPVYEVGEDACGAAYVMLIDLIGPSCPPREILPLHRVGEQLEVTRVFRRTWDGGCEEREAPPARVHRLTPVDLSAFVAADRVEGTGAVLTRDHLLAEDGTIQPAGLRDAVRGEACDPTGVDTSVVGAERVPCMPPDARGYAMPGGASCDENWAIAAPGTECRTDLELVASQTEDACGRTTSIEVFRGTPIPEAERVWGEACDLGFFPDPLAVTLEPAGDAVPWLTREVRGADRVRRMVWAHDALEAIPVPYDSELETTCNVVTTTDGELRCLPGLVRSVHDGAQARFVDDACTVPGIDSSFLCRSSWVLSSAPASCTLSPVIEAVYRIGEPAARGYRLDESGACVPADGETVHTLERVPLTRFARLERSVD